MILPLSAVSWLKSGVRYELKNSFILKRGNKLVWAGVCKDTYAKSVQDSAVTGSSFLL